MISLFLFMGAAYADGNETNDFSSIQTMIDDSNPGDSIYLENVTYSGEGVSINIDKDINIYGSNNTVLDAKFSSSIFSIAENVNVNITGLTLINGDSKLEDAGSIFNKGNLNIISTTISNSHSHSGSIYNSKNACLTISNSILTGNTADTGSAIYNDGGIIIINNSTIQNSIASGDGGAIYTIYGTITVYNSRFISNTANFGGAIYNNKGNVKIYDSDMDSNIARQLGGAIKNWGYCEVYNSKITNNSADDSGGGIYTFQYSLTLINCEVNTNNASLGGGIYCDSNSKLDITSSKITNNKGDDGAGIYVNQGDFTLKNSKVENNRATSNGGGIYLNSPALIMHSLLKGNTAANGGGAIYNAADLTIYNSTFTLNEANIAGAVYNSKSLNIDASNFNQNMAFDCAGIYSTDTLIIDNSEFANNQITHRYGVIMIMGETAKISNSVFKLNRGSDEGGSIYISDGVVEIDNTGFIKNTAKSYGGAINNDGTLKVTNSQFSQNQAYGAGAIDNGGNLTIINSNFTANVADGKNGGAIDTKGYLVVNESIFKDNTATQEGGAIIGRGDSYVSHSSFVNNRAGIADAVYLNDVDYSISDNWWGSNNPDFDKLININLPDDFTWIHKNIETVLSASNLNFVYKDGKSLVATLKDIEGNLLPNQKVQINIAGKTYNMTTNTNGQAKLPINLYAQIYPTVIRYSGNDEYANSSITVNVNVKKVATKLISSNLNVDYNAGKSLVATLKDSGGNQLPNKKISFKIVGKTYTFTTNSKGQVKLPINLYPKSYPAVITFAGDKGYEKSSASVNVNVKKLIPKLTALKKTFSLNSKTKSYSVNLKDNEGKVLRNKMITIKINSKTYSVKTNKYGNAIFNLKLNKIGSYEMAVKFNADRYFNAVATSIKITVKK